METVLKRHTERMRRIAYRSFAYVAIAGITFLTSKDHPAYSMPSQTISPLVDEMIYPPGEHIFITDGMVSHNNLLTYSADGLREIYQYPLFHMAAYEAKTEKAKNDIHHDADIHAVYHSDFHPIANSTEGTFGQTWQETSDGWDSIMHAVGITTLATLYHADVSKSEICFIDTAFDVSHPAIAPHIAYEECDSSETDDIRSLCVEGKHPASDKNCDGECNHGTMTASAGIMNSPVKASLFKTASAFGGDAPGLKDIDILAGFHGCLKRKREGYNVVAANLSASHYSTFSKACNDVESAMPYAQVFKKMTEYGIPVVISSGNFSEKNEVGIPACVVGDADPLSDGIFSVSSSAFKNGGSASIAEFTNRSTLLTSIFAPGTDIPVATTGNYFGTASGTSFSAPITALSLAYLNAAIKNLTPGKREELLHNGAVQLYDGGELFFLLDAARSAQKASSNILFQDFFPHVSIKR